MCYSYEKGHYRNAIKAFIQVDEMLTKCFPRRESNPGLLGESQLSLPLDHVGHVENWYHFLHKIFTCSLVSSTDLASAVAATIPRTIINGPLSLSATIFQTDSPLLSTPRYFSTKYRFFAYMLQSVKLVCRKWSWKLSQPLGVGRQLRENKFL